MRKGDILLVKETRNKFSVRPAKACQGAGEPEITAQSPIPHWHIALRRTKWNRRHETLPPSEVKSEALQIRATTRVAGGPDQRYRRAGSRRVRLGGGENSTASEITRTAKNGNPASTAASATAPLSISTARAPVTRASWSFALAELSTCLLATSVPPLTLREAGSICRKRDLQPKSTGMDSRHEQFLARPDRRGASSNPARPQTRSSSRHWLRLSSTLLRLAGRPLPHTAEPYRCALAQPDSLIERQTAAA